MSYVSSKEAQKFFKVSDQTLRRWASSNQIKFKTTPGGHRRYLLPSNDKAKIIYCRVSSSKQKEDLGRQVKFMQNKYPDYEVIKDVGSGINCKRRGFLSLLQRIFQGSVSEVVVASNDRISRFNQEFFEWLFLQFGCELVSLNSTKEKSTEQELTEDLISVITVFAARYHGARKYKIEGRKRKFSKEKRVGKHDNGDEED
jgi:predicted site-specific integrase-resolvase